MQLDFLRNYYYILSVLFILLLYASFEDIKSRKVTTITFLAMNVLLLIYYLFVDWYISILLIPLIMEYYLKKFSVIPYVVVMVPLLMDHTIIIISISYSILLIKLLSIFMKNLGRGDVKILQTIAAAFPIYPNLNIIYSILPPVIVLMLLASIIGMGSGLMLYFSNMGNKEFRWKFTSIPLERVKHEYKYWIKKDRAIYKIPFVTFITASYSIIFILSLLRLV